MANRKRNVAYVEQEVPTFLKQFKERVGFKEGPDLKDKFQVPDFDADEEKEESDDEKPQVVVLKKGDLTAAEVEAVTSGTRGDSHEDEELSGKLVFKKPVKRQGKDFSDLIVSTKRSKNDTDSSELKTKLKDKNKKIKNKKLLSFDEDEEDD